jgi:hypothetical protein
MPSLFKCFTLLLGKIIQFIYHSLELPTQTKSLIFLAQATHKTISLSLWHTSKCSFYLPCLLIDAQMQTQYLWKTLQFKSKTNIASLNKANFQFSASGVGRRLCVLKGPIDFFKHRSKTKLGCYCQSSVSPPMGKTWRVCNPKL